MLLPPAITNPFAVSLSKRRYFISFAPLGASFIILVYSSVVPVIVCPAFTDEIPHQKNS